MPDAIAALLERYGYAVVFVGVLLENAGIPVPGETLLLAGTFFAARGVLSFPVVVGLATLAAVLGDNAGYWIGRRAGRPLVERYGGFLGLTPGRLAALDGFFARHGAMAVLFARFVTGLRVFAAVFAGVSRFPWPRFVLYNAAGAVGWATAVGLVGFYFGRSWSLLERWVGRTGLFALGLAAALGLVVLARRHGRALVGAVRTHVAARLPAVLTLREAVLVGAVLAVVGVFAKIAEDVVTRESTGFDRGVSLALHGLATPRLDAVMRILTAAGSAPAALAVAAATMGLCLWRRDRRAATACAAVAIATEALNLVLKEGFGRARPALWPGVAELHSYAFPSGHAMASAAIYGMAAVIVGRLLPRLRGPAGLAAAVLVVLIGLSRVYLGAHWATDVLAGFAAGAFVLLAGVYALERSAA